MPAPTGQVQFLLIVIGIVIPPLAVFLAKRYSIWNVEFAISVVLTLMGFPGMIFTVYWLKYVYFPEQEAEGYNPIPDPENQAGTVEQNQGQGALQEEGFIHHHHGGGHHHGSDRHGGHRHGRQQQEQPEENRARQPYRDYPEEPSTVSQAPLLTASDLPSYDEVGESGSDTRDQKHGDYKVQQV